MHVGCISFVRSVRLPPIVLQYPEETRMRMQAQDTHTTPIISCDEMELRLLKLDHFSFDWRQLNTENIARCDKLCLNIISQSNNFTSMLSMKAVSERKY